MEFDSAIRQGFQRPCLIFLQNFKNLLDNFPPKVRDFKLKRALLNSIISPNL